MFFVSKKVFEKVKQQRDEFEAIAAKAVAQNGRLIDEWGDTIEEMKGVQELNRQLVERNEELVAQVKELEAKLDFVIKQRDYYYDLLESTSEEEGEDE